MIVLVLTRICPNFAHFYRYYFEDYLQFTKIHISIVDTMRYAGVIVASLIFYKYCNQVNIIFVFGLVIVLTFFSKLILIPGIIDGFVDSKYLRVAIVSFQNFAFFFLIKLNMFPINTILIKLCPMKLAATSICLFSGILAVLEASAIGLASLIVSILDFKDNDYSLVWVTVTLEIVFTAVALSCLFFVRFKPSQFDIDNLQPTREESVDGGQAYFRLNDDQEMDTQDNLQMKP